MVNFAKFVGLIFYLAFCFFVVVSFNPKSAEVILNGMVAGSEFYEKTRNAMFFLMVFLIVVPLQIFVVYVLIHANKTMILKKFVFFSLIFSILIVLSAYYFSGVFPFRTPVVN